MTADRAKGASRSLASAVAGLLAAGAIVVGCGGDDGGGDSGGQADETALDRVGLRAAEWVTAVRAGDEDAACDLEEPDDVAESGCPDYDDSYYDPVRASPETPAQTQSTDAFFDLPTGETLVVDLAEEDYGQLYVVEWFVTDENGKAVAHPRAGEGASEETSSEPGGAGTDCGLNGQGSQVVINDGLLDCDEAIRVSEEWGQAGYQDWDCGDPGETVDGETLSVDQGYSCQGPGGERISVIEATDRAPSQSGSGGGGRCPEGQDYNRSLGECVVAETGEAPGGDPYADPPQGG